MAEDRDLWKHRSVGMSCATCMFFIMKEPLATVISSGLGRCRRHGPTLQGWPAVFPADWCGDHKLDENKIVPEVPEVPHGQHTPLSDVGIGAAGTGMGDK